ncbi:MAG: hypothetical protein A2583_15020 [Bdellovibrionales bacterium RIFOXYD1_FULL_53_11]|nr:MAG: hypothetical protein A2583_15020 [Bdellovibrionales bacterium RIFOXYD1_FULL_53_11]
MKEGDLSKRVKTGVIGGAALLLLLIFGGRIGGALIGVIMSIGMLSEFIDMTFTLSDKPEKKFVMLGTAWLVAFINFWMPRAEFELLLIVMMGLFAYYLFTVPRHKAQWELQAHFKELMAAVFGTLYLMFLPLFFPLIHDSVHGTKWAAVFLLVVWMGDTGAYFIGRKYGERKLYPLISPKKTVEGALGGLGAGLVVTLLSKAVFFRAMPWGAVFIIPVFVGAFAQLGDLCESFLKRAYEKKDSGSILPGHGGFLDRFDGVVLGLPVMYACMRLFG